MLEQQGSSQHVSCPDCHFRGNYRLADGRRKCRRCGKKYSSKLRRSNLAPMVLKQLALSFWLAVPADSTATSLGINIKTVRRHYGLMRRAISLESICPAHDPMENSPGGEEPTGLCFFVTEEGVRIAAIRCEWIGGDACGKSGGVVPCRHWRIHRKIRLPKPLQELDCSLCFVAGPGREWTPACERELVKLRKLATKLCRMERRRERFKVLEELAFRFNHRSDPGVTALLYDFMKPVNNARISEE